MKKKDFIIYDYINRSDVITQNKIDTLNKVYEISYPKPEKSFIEMCDDLHKIAKEKGRENDANFRVEYNNEETGKTYFWPVDFFYIPQRVLEEVWNNHKDSYGITEHWKEDISALSEFLFEKPGLKEVYEPTEFSNGEKIRHSIDQSLLKDIIGEENTQKVKELIEDYKNTYRWGLMDVNQFCSGFLSTPSTNRETVVEAWKTAFGKDILIPDDDKWIDTYEFDDMEFDGKFDDDETTEVSD